MGNVGTQFQVLDLEVRERNEYNHISLFAKKRPAALQVEETNELEAGRSQTVGISLISSGEKHD